EQQLPLHVGFELLNAHVLLRQIVGINILADEFALGKQGGHKSTDTGSQVVIGNLETEALGFIDHGALGNHGLDDLRDVVGDELGRQLLAAEGQFNTLLDFGQQDLILTDLGYHLVRRAAGSVVVTRDQVGKHGQRYQHQQSAEQNTHGFIAAAKQVKHWKGT